MQSSCALRHNDNNNELRWGGASETRVVSTNLNNDRISQSHSRGQYIMSDSFKQTLAHGGEDMRVSKLIRRLLNEDSVPIWLDLCKKLEVAVCIPANATYINRSFDGLLDNILAVMKKCPPACSTQLTSIVGLIGYIGRSSFSSFEGFIRKNYKCNKRIQKDLVLSLKIALSYDTEKHELDIYSERIIQLLKEFLENVETGDMFIVITSTTVLFAKNYTYKFEQHFTDIVDIVIGWHLESKEKKQVREHCAYVLQEFAPYFKNKLPFTFGLLSQFIEDISGLSDQVTSELILADLEQLQKSDNGLTALDRVGSFVGAFNSLLKCLLQNTNFVNTQMYEDILGQALKAISHFSLKLIAASQVNAETFNNINELYSICLMSGLNAIHLDDLQNIIEEQLLHLSNFDEEHKVSALYLTLCLVRKQRSTLQTDFVRLIFNNETESTLYKCLAALKLCVNKRGNKILLRIHQEILLTKNVPLLQMAYKCLTVDINKCIKVITGDYIDRKSSSHELLEAEAHLNFNLSALAALATQTSSIIGMYACKPSILDLLMVNCRADDIRVWAHNPTIHHSILILLIAHCQTNHNYRNTSRIFQCSDTGSNTLTEHTSPTAENFTTILRFISHCLEQAANMNVENLKVILKWTQTLLVECKDNAAIMYQNEYFVSICKTLNGRIATWAPIECSACIEVLLSYVPVSVDLLLLIRETASQQLDTLDSQLRSRFGKIYANLPLSITLRPKNSSRLPQDELTQSYRASKNYASIRDKFFKIFLDTFNDTSESRLANTLQICFAERLIEVNDKNIDNYLTHARNSYRMLNNWLQFEVARYMVEQKLRTCVGKPQDTFLAIEAIIMRYARLMSNPRELSDCENAELTLMKSVCTQRNMRFLLGFLDALEKQVYNAAEGSAFAYNPPEKPARSFFRLNTSTCQSWFSRIRPGIILLGIHSMEPETVLRYSEEMLMLLKQNDEPFIQSIVYITWALLNCNESDTLEGVYAWVRAKTGKRYQWIQCASEQAAGRKENAIVGYRALLSDYDLDNLVRQFIIAQIMECLNDTGQWSNLKKFKEQLSTEDANYINPFTQRKNTELSKMEALLSSYERSTAANDDLVKAINDLTIWPENEKDASDVCRLSHLHFEHVLENICVDQALSKNVGNASLSVDVQHALELSWHEALLSTSSADRHRTNTILLKHVADQLLTDNGLSTITPVTNDSSVFGVSKRTAVGSTVLIKCLSWSLLLEKRTNTKVLNSLYLDIAESARKECNYKCCQTMLERFFARRNYTTPLPDISAQLLNDRNYQLNIADTELLRGYGEIAKWLYAQEKPTEVESINLGAALCLRIHKQIDQLTEKVNYPTISADMLLTLAEWLTQRSCSGVPINNAILQHLLGVLPELPLAAGHAIPEADKIIGRLINASIHQQESCEDAWMTFGNWCYRWGKRVVEARSNDNSSLLSAHDITQIKEAIGDEGNTLDTGIIYQLVGILNKHANDNAEDIEPNDEYSTSTELLKCELRNFDILSDKPVMVIERIINIWRQASKSIYDFYEASARAYFRYLCLKASNTLPGEREHRYHVDDCSMVTTTLRLLRLIVKHAVGLQEVLEEGLKTTPIQPWKVIIPQLFSRLNHHEPYVRKSVSELLCRLAENRPHLVIFPAVVGANRELKTLEQCQASESSVQLSNCFSSLLNTLSKQAPQTVAHVQLLVKELKRVCLLWDEYWIHSLAHIYSNYLPCVNAIDTEFKPNDVDGRNKRFNTFRDQIVTDLENVAAFTARNPETDYEHTFKIRFDTEIKRTIDDLRSKKFPDAWDRLKQFYTVLQQNQIRGNSATLKMQNVSPVLANMTKTDISMPGVDLYEREPIYIRAVETTVRILPTKTKPKKVAFYGSNGQRYTYLFKGLEDLHLDERIMQFLSISNSIMAHKNDATTKTCFKAHHYSVIPLGPQSGLISWVDGVTPLFALYKKWQQREAQLKVHQLKVRPNNDNNKANPMNETEQAAPTKRLTELFYGKLTPLLAKHNMKVTDPRKQWPLSVLRQVYNELTRETPRDLLVRELWCNAINASEWRKSVRCYTASMAVMSVIGYVIGLGDRHLDNVLINLESGEIVHIDYNVCFEKGKTLRIPEKVPFRLTQNFVEALGITGVEGEFRLGCEYVLKMMRKERETLLTLLEAFVYDPLVDWTVGEDGAVNRRANVVKAAALNMNASSTVAACKVEKYAVCNKKQDWEQTRLHISKKLSEIRTYWLQYNDDVDRILKTIASDLDDLLKARADMQQAELERDELVKQSALIREIESLGTAISSHSFNTAVQRYITKKHFTESLHKAQAIVATQYENISRILTLYKQCTQLPGPLSDLSVQLFKQKFIEHDWHSEYQLVAEVLPNSRQSLANYQSDRLEMDALRTRINNISIECIEQLQQYVAIIRFMPSSKLKRNPYIIFEQTYSQYIKHHQSSSNEADIDLTLLKPSPPNAQQADEVLYKATAMEQLWNELTYDLHQATYQLETEKAQCISVSDTINALHTYRVAIQQQNRGAELYAALAHAIYKCNETFELFEKSALASEDDNLLMQQANYVNVINTMLEKVVGESVNDFSKVYKNLSTLQRTLKMIVELKDIFQYELPKNIYRLFLISDKDDVFERLCAMDASKLYNAYKEAVAGLEEEEAGQRQHALEQPISLSLRTKELEFFSLLRRACMVHKQLVGNLVQVWSIAHQLFEHVEDETDLKLFMQSNILCNEPQDLELSKLFDVVHESLLIARNYDVRSFVTPISNYVMFLERKYLVGLTPLFTIEVLTNLNAHSDAKISVVPTPDAIILFENLYMALQHDALIMQQQQNIVGINKLMELISVASSAHNWANEDALLGNNCGHIIYREKLLGNIYHKICALKKLIDSAVGLQHDLSANIVEIQKEKSNWNRNHVESFVRGEELQHQFDENNLTLAKHIVNYGNAVRVIERFALENDIEDCQCYADIEHWNYCYLNWRHSNSAITAEEEATIELLNPEGPIDNYWLININALLEDQTCTVQRKISQFESLIQTKQKSINDVQYQLQQLLDATHCIEMRTLISMTAKLERNTRNFSLGIYTLTTRLRDAQTTMKNYSVKLGDLRQYILTIRGNISDTHVIDLRKKLEELRKCHYNEEMDEVFHTTQEYLQRISETKSMQSDTTMQCKVAINPYEQKRNAYGVMVWKKIRMKLEGREPDSSRRTTVAEQIDYIIHEATNIDNLAVLYEGWTPWV